MAYAPGHTYQGQPSKGGSYDSLAAAGMWLSLTGQVTGAIGAYYDVLASQGAAKSQALSLEYEQSASALEARAAERDAEAILSAGRQEVGLRGLQEGQEIGAATAEQAASGIGLDSGSAAEVRASIRLAAAIDKRTISSNALRAALAERQRGAGIRGRGALAGVSARNLRRTAGSMSPGTAAAGSALAGGGQLLSQYASYYGRR